MINRKKFLLLILVLLPSILIAIIASIFFLSKSKSYSNIQSTSYYEKASDKSIARFTGSIKGLSEKNGIIYADVSSPAFNSETVKMVIFDPEFTLFIRKSSSPNVDSLKYDELPAKIKNSNEAESNLKPFINKNLIFTLLLNDPDKSDKVLKYLSCNNDLVDKIDNKSNTPLICQPYTKEITVYVEK